MVIRVAVVLWSILFPYFIKAFDNPAVSYLGIEHGLSNNSVTCVFQDHKGFMWFGPYDGLNRYDGLPTIAAHCCSACFSLWNFNHYYTK